MTTEQKDQKVSDEQRERLAVARAKQRATRERISAMAEASRNKFIADTMDRL